MNINNKTFGRTASMGTCAAIALMAFCGITAANAETMTLTGKGTYFVDRDLMPLGNGGAALHTTNTTVVSVEPSESGVMFGECAGLAYLSPESTLSSRVYCNFSENGKDTFVVQADLEAGKPGGKISILGGSGKFANATGSGKITPLGEEDSQGRYSYEFNITTP